MSLDRTNPTPPRSVQENLAGYKARADRLDGRVKQLETELARTRELMNSAHAEARQMSAMLDGIGDDLTRRYETALERSEADPGRREHAVAVRETRAAVDSYKTIRGTDA